MRILSTLALAGILAFAGISLLSPAPAIAASGCVCLVGGLTPSTYGSGATCALAEADMIDQLEPYINCDDGSCGYSPIFETSCITAKNGFVIRGRLSYRCFVCF